MQGNRGWVGCVWRMGSFLLIEVIIDQAEQRLRAAITGSAPGALHSTTATALGLRSGRGACWGVTQERC